MAWWIRIPNLREITFREMSTIFGDDFFIDGEKRFPKLEKIYLHDNDGITGKGWNLEKWPALVNVNITKNNINYDFNNYESKMEDGVWIQRSFSQFSQF